MIGTKNKDPKAVPQKAKPAPAGPRTAPVPKSKPRQSN